MLPNAGGEGLISGQKIKVPGQRDQNFLLKNFLKRNNIPSLVAQLVKNPPAMRETWVPSLSWEDLLEKGKATHSSILAWRIPHTQEPGRLQSMGLQRVRRD